MHSSTYLLRLLYLYFSLTSAKSLVSNSRTSHVHESRSSVPSGFSRQGPAPSEQILNLRFALVQKDPNGLIDALYSVSDPQSSEFRKYLSKQQVEAFVSPAAETLQTVNTWLQSHNLTATSASPSGDWISIDIPVDKANTLFTAEFDVYSHDESGKQILRTLSYSLPEDLRGHVDLIHPTTSFPDPLSDASFSRQKRPVYYTAHDVPKKCDNTSACANRTTPACLQELYKIPTTPARNPSNRLGVTGFYGNEAHFAYLKVFLETYRPDMDSDTNFTVVGIDGGSDEQNPYSVLEGDLDLQYTVGVATGVPVTEYFVGPDIQDGVYGFLDAATFILALDDPPQVLTTSYAHEETVWSFAITDRICQAYAQLGARGTTVLFASGDSGPGCSPTNSTNFEANFPASCPYVTAVGGTNGYAPELAWSGSSGGFSDYYPRPSYQDKHVRAYLSTLNSTSTDPNRGRYNASGRAIPDIAAKADMFSVYAAGYYAPVYGTSAASPTVADIIALLNDRLLSAGRPPLGFLNPWLYADAHEAFTDITAGNSSIQCSDTDPLRGFNATRGWDPVTGLGTPRFDRLLELLNLC